MIIKVCIFVFKFYYDYNNSENQPIYTNSEIPTLKTPISHNMGFAHKVVGLCAECVFTHKLRFQNLS